MGLQNSNLWWVKNSNSQLPSWQIERGSSVPTGPEGYCCPRAAGSCVHLVAAAASCGSCIAQRSAVRLAQSLAGKPEIWKTDRYCQRAPARSAGLR